MVSLPSQQGAVVEVRWVLSQTRHVATAVWPAMVDLKGTRENNRKRCPFAGLVVCDIGVEAATGHRNGWKDPSLYATSGALAPLHTPHFPRCPATQCVPRPRDGRYIITSGIRPTRWRSPSRELLPWTSCVGESRAMPETIELQRFTDLGGGRRWVISALYKGSVLFV